LNFNSIHKGVWIPNFRKILINIARQTNKHIIFFWIRLSPYQILLFWIRLSLFLQVSFFIVLFQFYIWGSLELQFYTWEFELQTLGSCCTHEVNISWKFGRKSPSRFRDIVILIFNNRYRFWSTETDRHIDGFLTILNSEY